MGLFDFKKKDGKKPKEKKGSKLEKKLLQDFKDGKVLKIEKDYSTFNQKDKKQNSPKQTSNKQKQKKQNGE